jgi:hypothetical protein
MEELWSRYGEKASAEQPRKLVSICGTGKRFGRFLGLFLGSKSPGHEAEHSFPSRLQIKNEWISASTPYDFMECKGRN